MSNPVKQFFVCIANKDITGALELVHENAVFEAQGPETVPIYGRFEGRDGVQRFLSILSEIFETEAFEFYKWGETDNFVFAFGYMQHHVRKTGKTFKCEWALVCQIKDNHISSYKMFEDTAALQSAYL